MRERERFGDRMQYWRECREFYRQFRGQYFTTGSILPSSRALGRALVRPFTRQIPPRKILEVGPGTGAVTSEILRQLRPADHLDIVEINPDFVALLERRFTEEPHFQRRAHQVRLIHAPLQMVEGAGVYDFLISGLPLNNFPIALVREIFVAYRRLLKPEGTLSYFEYLHIRRLKLLTSGRKERRRLGVLDRFLTRRLRAFQIDAENVYCNFPPAVARHLRFT